MSRHVVAASRLRRGEAPGLASRGPSAVHHRQSHRIGLRPEPAHGWARRMPADRPNRGLWSLPGAGSDWRWILP
jgi:hypothetical protein